MALAKGFKQSEVGMIPADWNLIEVDHLSTSVASGRSKQDSQYGDFPLYGSTGIIGTVTKGEYSGDAILVARVGANAGQINIVSGAYGVTDNTIIVKIKSSFPLHYVWRQLEAKKLNRMVFGSGQPLITGTQIKAIKIPVPTTRGEQEAIANALSDADALIESLEKLIAKKRLIKKGAMQELLTPDKTWRSTNLLELCDGRKELFDDGDWIEAEHITNEGVRLIQTGNVGVGEFIDREEKKYIFETSFQKLKCKQLQTGDLLICRLADPAGRACILPDLAEDKVITSVDVTICRPSYQKADRRFLVQMFSTNGWLQSISERSGGTTHKRIARALSVNDV